MNFPVNRTDLKLFRHLRNTIHVLVKNIDRKPVTIPNGSTLVVQAYDKTADEVLFLKTLSLVDSAQSLWAFTINPSDILDWSPRTVNYIVMVKDSNDIRTPLYTDRNYTPHGTLELLDGPLVPATDPLELDVSTFIVRGEYSYSSPLEGAAQVANPSGQHTIAIYGDNFNGKVIIEANLDADPSTDDSQWAEVDTFDTIDMDDSILDGVEQVTFEGNYVWVRFKVFKRANEGSLVKILYRN